MILIVVTGQLGGSEVFVRNRPNEPLGSNPNRYPEEIDRYHCHPVIVRGFNIVHPSFKKRFHVAVYLVSQFAIQVSTPGMNSYRICPFVSR